MYEKTIIIFSTYFILFLAIMVIGLFFFIVQYRKTKKQEILEKEMTAQRHAKELLSTRLDIQQKTMTEIGRDLHDNIGQKLTLASIYTQQMSHNEDFDNIEAKVLELTNLLNETLQDIRGVSKTLINANIENNSLSDLIKNECKKVEQSKICKIEFKDELSKDNFNTNEKLVLLRISQEFIQNSLKYANCSLISIYLYEKDGKTYLTLKDNGIGFDVAQYQLESKGIGLKNMKNRAAIINAKFNLESQQGVGTSLTIIL